MSEVQIKTLANGLTLIIDQMPEVESVAYELLIPGGVIVDSEATLGASLMLSELSTRGADDLDTRALSDAFEKLGVRHGEYTAHDRFVYRGALLGENLEPALTLVAKMILKPRFPESEIGNVRSLFLQDLASLEDNPARWAMEELNSKYYPAPFGRATLGSESGLNATSRETIQELWARCYTPRGAVLSICGRVEPQAVLQMAERVFGSWSGEALARPNFGAMPKHAAHHHQVDSAQLQIVLAFPAAKFGEPDYYVAKVVNGILSGGMFGRLFIEVREKRGLCYSVYSRHSATKEYGTVLVYAGTTPDRAQETLDVSLAVLHEVKGAASEEELARAKANIKSSIVLGEESSGSRASSSAVDWWIAGRVRPLSEIRQAIDAVSINDVNAYLEKYGPHTIMLQTLGAKKLDLPKEMK